MHFHRWAKWIKKEVIDTKVAGIRRGGKYHMERFCETCGHVQVRMIITP